MFENCELRIRNDIPNSILLFMLKFAIIQGLDLKENRRRKLLLFL